VFSIAWLGMAAASFGAAIAQAATGFGFAVLATPLYLLFLAPAAAIQQSIIVTLALSLVVLPGLHRSLDVALLARLALGSLIGLPFGLAAFSHADPVLVRGAAGATILAFAGLLARARWRGGRGEPLRPGSPSGAILAISPTRDCAAGAVAGVTTALLGMSGPPVLIYLMLAGAPPQAVRASLLYFFALSYAVTLAAHAATVGVPRATWAAAAGLVPFAWIGGLVGRRIARRIGHDGFARLAVALLAVAGLYTSGDAVRLALRGG
jgi:uncharacterized membrane protein YfcA